MTSKIISMENITFSWKNKEHILLKHISFEVNQGEYVAIVGENGCGKSTLIRLLLGLLPCQEGQIHCYANHIGYVQQKNEWSNQDFPITVYELLYSYSRIIRKKDGTGIRWNKSAQKEKIEDALKWTGMEAHAKQLVTSLSGGQIQKVLLSRALLAEPDLLVLDEPSTGIDTAGKIEIYNFIEKLRKEKGITIISVEHNMEAVFSYATRVYHMRDGEGHFCEPERYRSEYMMYEKK